MGQHLRPVQHYKHKHVMQPVHLHFSCSTYVLIYKHITTVIYILHNDEMQLHIL